METPITPTPDVPVFHWNNFGQQNTPPIVEKVGNVLLSIGGAGIAVIALPSMGIALPAAILTYAGYAVAAGTIGKIFCKFFGVKSE